MRGSYSNHYRRMVPHILYALSFRASNETSKPIIAALALMRKCADKKVAFYPEDEVIPIEGVVKPDQRELIQQGQKINRINYELCALPSLREKLKSRPRPRSPHAGAFDSGYTDTAERAEELLGELGFGEDGLAEEQKFKR
jgi:hypothetical protein